MASLNVISGFAVRLVGAVLLLLALPARAQETPFVIPLLEPVEGEITTANSQEWIFTAVDSEVLSFSVQTVSGELDPMIEIFSSAGVLVISEDDVAYPNDTSAVLEAITFARADTYTLVVRGYGSTAGRYTLTMLPGLGTLSGEDTFSGGAQWRPLEDGLQVEMTGGRLRLGMEGNRLIGVALQPGVTEGPSEFFTQVDVAVEEASASWITGLAARVRDDGSAYILRVNSNGEWQFAARANGDETILRNWTPHPAIVANQRIFRLGMLVNGVGFDFFYDGKLIGKVNDASLAPGGRIGLMLETASSPSSRVVVSFDNLVVTTPALVNGERVTPQQLMSGTPAMQAQELQRRGLIPAGGEMALTVAESSVELRSPGVNRLGLGRGLTFQNLAMGATVSWQAAFGGTTGCGLVIRAQDESNYTLIYVDQTGAFGASRRAGEAFEPGIFGQTPRFTGSGRQLLVIARGDELLLYVDGRYAGRMQDSQIDGSVGNAVVNFEPISTACQFADTWVWSWSAS